MIDHPILIQELFDNFVTIRLSYIFICNGVLEGFVLQDTIQVFAQNTTLVVFKSQYALILNKNRMIRFGISPAQYVDALNKLQSFGYLTVIDNHILLNLDVIYETLKREGYCVKDMEKCLGDIKQEKVDDIVDERTVRQLAKQAEQDDQDDLKDKLLDIANKYVQPKSEEKDIKAERWNAATQILGALISAIQDDARKLNIPKSYIKEINTTSWRKKNLSIIHNVMLKDCDTIEELYIELDLWTKLPVQYYKDSFWKKVSLTPMTLLKFARFRANSLSVKSLKSGVVENAYRVVRKIDISKLSAQLQASFDLRHIFVTGYDSYVYEDMLMIVDIEQLVQADAILGGTFYEHLLPKN